ncbi:uncharacterized protein LOC111876849 [Lactuca sativa]|uniref:uncharacterized protein LOC111876849 n=1 Tax=Lactuca sativa TaxID=4236 RepID=UPI000CD9DE5F|nr:uncharacterized protein LOC111876849 [Lactuca sativa]
MNIFSNNIRGIGGEVKREWIKNSRIQHHSVFVGLQETKSYEVKGGLDKFIWGPGNFQSEVVDPMGLFGGIVSLWDPSIFCAVESIKGVGFLCIKGVWLKSKKTVCFVNVYAPQDLNEKKLLWNKLFDLINSDSNVCWTVFGDFNAVRFPEERLGSIFCPQGAYYFNKFIFLDGLLEIKMGGRRFTYMNSKEDKHSKLDRYLVSPNVLDSWPHLNVTTLPRVHSDHCAIIISSNQLDFGPYPFRFFNSWLKDQNLEMIIVNGWSLGLNFGLNKIVSPLSVVVHKLKNLKEHIKAWRKEVIEANKKEPDELTNTINAIDLLAESGPMHEDLLKNRQYTYQKILEVESSRMEDLRQKS